MDEVERLFKEAERLGPPESMWRTIAARCRAGGAEPAGSGPEAGHGRWAARMAASLVLGLAALAALLLLTRDPRRTAPAPLAADAGEDGTVLDEDVLAWHADLGDESAGAWDGEAWAGDGPVLEAGFTEE